MKPPGHLMSLCLAAVCLAVPVQLAASGSYTARPPQPPVQQPSVDKARYSLGQRLFNGKVQPSGTADAATQTERLKGLQARLPAKVAAKHNLTAMAGKLTPEQLDALEYYVTQRYAK